MQVIHARCAGLDVHKNSVSACVLCWEGRARKSQEVRVFGTMTRQSTALADWLKAHGYYCPTPRKGLIGIH
jgi:transposase